MKKKKKITDRQYDAFSIIHPQQRRSEGCEARPVELMQAVSSPKRIMAHISPLHITFSVYQYYIAPLARPFVSYLSLCTYQTPFNY